MDLKSQEEEGWKSLTIERIAWVALTFTLLVTLLSSDANEILCSASMPVINSMGFK